MTQGIQNQPGMSIGVATVTGAFGFDNARAGR